MSDNLLVSSGNLDESDMLEEENAMKEIQARNNYKALLLRAGCGLLKPVKRSWNMQQ